CVADSAGALAALSDWAGTSRRVAQPAGESRATAHQAPSIDANRRRRGLRPSAVSRVSATTSLPRNRSLAMLPVGRATLRPRIRVVGQPGSSIRFRRPFAPSAGEVGATARRTGAILRGDFGNAGTPGYG